MDTREGNGFDPTTLHKYLYAGSDPVDRRDPSGHDFDLGDVLVTAAAAVTIAAIAILTFSQNSISQSPQFQGVEAQNDAKLLAISAINTLQNGSTWGFVQYFGMPANTDRTQRIANNYLLILNYLQHDITFASSNANEYAHCFLNQPDRIWLGKLFYSAPWSGIDSKPGALIHEVTHLALQTVDQQWGGVTMYGQQNAMTLADQAPSQAEANPDNYEYFAETNNMYGGWGSGVQ